MSIEQEAPSGDRGISRRAMECTVAFILMLVAVAALWDSYSRGAGWNAGPQSGFFPARIAWLLLLASAFVFYSGLRSSREVVLTWDQLIQVIKVFVPLTFYVLLNGYIGIYFSSALFILAFMLAFGSFRWWSPIAAAVLIPGLTFWVFEFQFQVPLPKGPIEAMLGY